MATTTTTSSNHDGGGDLSSPWCIVVKTVGRGFENRRSLDSNSNGANDHQATTSKVLSVGSDGALSFSVTVSPNDRVDSLHDEIEDVTGVKASQQRLIYRGRLIGTADVGTSHAWFRSNNSNYNSNSNSNSNINSNSNSNSNNNGGASPLGIEHQHETETNDQDSKTCRDDSERENQPQEYKIRDIVGLCDGQTIHLVKKREDDTKLNSGSTEEAAASREGNAGEDNANNNNNSNSNSNSNSNNNDKPKEWPPSFQNDGSAFTFDARSAMFYEPLSDFFYDPKSKLYYGNKKSAYYRYDETKEPPFVEVKRMTSEEVEEQQRGGGGGFSQEKLAMGDPAVPDASKPKIAIKLKTKKVRSSESTVAAIEGRNHHHHQQQQAATTTTVSRAKKEQIANIGKWTEKQAELKHTEPGNVAATPDEGKQTPQGKVRTTVKGEPICALCKRKFPTLEKFRLHEKASELHKKNLLKLQEKKKNKQQQQQQQQQQGDSGIKRKVDENLTDASNVTPTSSNEPVYTDRAQKRRQLHGMDLSTPANGLHSLRRQDQRHGEAQVETHTHTQIDPTPGSDLLNETNVGHRMLQKLGYKQQPQPLQHNREQDQPADSGNDNKPRSANEHLRKEWDRIEAMAAKSKPRYHSNY